MELNKDFFQNYLNMISQTFKDNQMTIVECQTKEGETKHVLCHIDVDGPSVRFTLIPIAVLFDKNPYMSLDPISDSTDVILASQQDINELFNNRIVQMPIDKLQLN